MSHVRPIALLLVVLCACGDREPRARGTVILELPLGSAGQDEIAARMATEIEVLTSRALAERAAEAIGIEPAQVDTIHRALRAARRGNSLLIDVGVDLEDPERARNVCNAVIEAFVTYRMSARLQIVHAQIQALSEAPGEHHAEVAALERERLTMQNDVRVLDRCNARR